MIDLVTEISFTGNEVVIVKSGKRICGSGAALANAAIVQNKCYFEMKVQSGGMDKLLFDIYKYWCRLTIL